MKQGSILFLKLVIVLIGIIALVSMIRFPLTEGRATNLDLLSIYWDPFIVYMYLASSVFFVALYQAFKLLGYVGDNKIFSLNSMKALRTIRYCAIAGIAFIVVGELALIVTQSGNEDMAGPVALGIMMICISTVIVTALFVLEKIVQSAVPTKGENNITLKK